MTVEEPRLVDDDFLVERALAKPDEFAGIDEVYARPVCRMCYCAVENVELAEDFNAKAILAAFERLDRYR